MPHFTDFFTEFEKKPTLLQSKDCSIFKLTRIICQTRIIQRIIVAIVNTANMIYFTDYIICFIISGLFIAMRSNTLETKRSTTFTT